MREYSPEDAAKLPPPPAGSKYVTLNDGAVLWDGYLNGGKGGPMLMPESVSLAENAKLGQELGRRAAQLGNAPSDPDVRMLPMIRWFLPHAGTMDYQSVYAEGWQYNRTYVDMTNYNYGVVAAAAGYSREEALMNAGSVNGFAHPLDATQRNGPFGNKVQNTVMIARGYDDYRAGRIVPFGG